MQLTAGADGIAVFNWHADGQSLRDMLSTIGKASTLQVRSSIGTQAALQGVCLCAWQLTVA